MTDREIIEHLTRIAARLLITVAVVSATVGTLTLVFVLLLMSVFGVGEVGQ